MLSFFMPVFIVGFERPHIWTLPNESEYMEAYYEKQENTTR